MKEKVKHVNSVLIPIVEGSEFPALAIHPETGEPYLVLGSRGVEDGIPHYDAIEPQKCFYPIVGQAIELVERLDTMRAKQGFPADPRGKLTAVALFAMLLLDGVKYALAKSGIPPSLINELAIDESLLASLEATLKGQDPEKN